MKQERRLFDAIGFLPERQIDEAQAHQFRKKPKLRRWTAIAAAGVIVLGVGGFALRQFGVSAPGANAGGGGGALEAYMRYAGPVFPLTSLSGAQGVTAAREITFDFAPYMSRTESYETDEGTKTYEIYDDQTIVTDAYTLVNEGDADVTLRLAYPFAGRFADPAAVLPTITVDGAACDADLLAGPYAGGFFDTYGKAAQDTERWNLAEPTSWRGFAALIENGYLSLALDAYPALSESVTVYKFYDYELHETDAANVVLNVRFFLPEGVQVLTFNSNGGTMDAPGTYQQRHVGGLNNEYRPPQPMYLVAVGGDLTDITTEGVEHDGKSVDGKPIAVTARMERTQTTLYEFLRAIIEDTDGYGWHFQPDEEQIYDRLPEGMFLGCVGELLTQYGVLGSDPAERYDGGMLEDILSETRSMMRLMYRTFTVTVPAHGSVSVTATMRRAASIDFVGENAGRNGYDLVTRLGSTLIFSEQWAAVKNAALVEFLRGNFGFDPENGVTRVQLDLNEPHYFMDVRKKK